MPESKPRKGQSLWRDAWIRLRIMRLNTLRMLSHGRPR